MKQSHNYVRTVVYKESTEILFMTTLKIPLFCPEAPALFIFDKDGQERVIYTHSLSRLSPSFFNL